MSEQVTAGKTNEAAAAGAVLVKLLIFTLSLGIVPISGYFVSLKYIWNGNSTYAAITAVVLANIVLVAYIISSILEDQKGASLIKVPLETKKKQ
ncbi:hypothetical protein L208DRAFT_1320745 [Tricholoma matsutake]|nr:hypothetical protein L208DRAFT_1320745 [Tricholoma matsutake 945]